MKFTDPGPVRISTAGLSGTQWTYYFSGSYDRDNGFIRDSLRVSWNMACQDARLDATYHPAHLWDNGLPSGQRTILLKGPSIIGLIEVSITNRPSCESFNRTCWILCGMIDGRVPHQPWIDLQSESPDGTVQLFDETYSSRELKTPFTLWKSSMGRWKMSSVSGAGSRSAVCIVRCTPTLSVMLRVSSLRDESPSLGAYHATITMEEVFSELRPEATPPLEFY